MLVMCIRKLFSIDSVGWHESVRGEEGAPPSLGHAHEEEHVGHAGHCRKGSSLLRIYLSDTYIDIIYFLNIHPVIFLLIYFFPFFLQSRANFVCASMKKNWLFACKKYDHLLIIYNWPNHWNIDICRFEYSWY